MREQQVNWNLGEEYFKHGIFDQLDEYMSFYKCLSFSIMCWVSKGTNRMLNIDTYVYTSMMGTIESIKDLLLKGRINDSYALLRKYYDSTIINVYTNLYLEDHFGIENFVVKQIDSWLNGKEKIPEYRILSEYIRASVKFKPIVDILLKDTRYKDIRSRCNDHTHYNFYQNLLLNDNEIYLDNRLKALDTLSSDLENIFIQHITYIFYLNDHYMSSSDYADSLEEGLQPEEGSEFLVAPFIIDVLYKILKVKRPDLYDELKRKSSMCIE